MHHAPLAVDTLNDSPSHRERRGQGRPFQTVAHFGALGLAVAAPMAVGGAPMWAQIPLCFAALGVFALWAVARRGDIPLCAFAGVAALGLGATLFQLVPLPAPLVESLSPTALALRTDAEGIRPSLLPLSLDVPATVLAAARGFACLAVLLLAANATRRRGRTLWLASTVTVVAAIIAGLSFFQRFIGAQSILGLYQIKEMPGSGFFGTFVNGNHAASLFSIGAVLSLGLLREARGRLRIGLGAAGLLCLMGLFSTSSRLGIVGAAVGAGTLISLWMFERLGTRRGAIATGILGLVGIPLAVVFALGTRGAPSAATLTTPLGEQKVRGWVDTLRLLGEYPWVGVGRGAFEGPAAAFRSDAEAVRLVYPENLLLQITSEWGLPVGAALIALFLMSATRVARRIRRWEPVFQAAACAVLAVLVHELGDFGLELLGVALPTALVLGLVAGRLGINRPPVTRAARKKTILVALPVGAAWVAVLFASLWAAPNTSDAEGARLARAAFLPPEAYDDAIRRHPAEYYFELLAARHAIEERLPDVMRHLGRAQRLFPQSPTPHLVTARFLAGIDRKSQAGLEFRLAAERGAPQSPAVLLEALGFEHVASAVAPEPKAMLELAVFLAQQGGVKVARRLGQRALALDPSEPSHLLRMDAAVAAKDPAFLVEAATELGPAARTSLGFEAAGRGWAEAGQMDKARETLLAGMKAFPLEGGYLVRAARILEKHGDLAGARMLLHKRTSARLSMADRIAAEELIAAIALREGHPEAAEAAQARVRMLKRLKHYPPGPGARP